MNEVRQWHSDRIVSLACRRCDSAVPVQQTVLEAVPVRDLLVSRIQYGGGYDSYLTHFAGERGGIVSPVNRQSDSALPHIHLHSSVYIVALSANDRYEIPHPRTMF